MILFKALSFIDRANDPKERNKNTLDYRELTPDRRRLQGKLLLISGDPHWKNNGDGCVYIVIA